MARHLFFSGKGGVGKTSLASATAVRLADAGQRTLLVTTDPASNLADVFEQEIGPSPRPIATVPGLDAQEIDAQAAARTYRDKALTPLRGLLPEEMLRTVEEQMSGPCTVEIAGFDEFIACMLVGHYDRVVFDTAPTGHTLRLLGLPAAWSVHIEDSAQGSGQTCIGPVDQLQTSKEQYDEAMRRLRDGEDTVFVFVSQPERTAVQETLRASRELEALGISNQRLYINGVIPEEAAAHPFFRSRREMQRAAIGELLARFPGAADEVPLLQEEVKGVLMLRELGKWVNFDVHAIR
ncbi:MAG: ArsA family ATPase [Clostridia bacterium]